MGKISGKNSVIWYFAQYRKNGQKLSKKAIFDHFFDIEKNTK
jgi:hypothetical protein